MRPATVWRAALVMMTLCAFALGSCPASADDRGATASPTLVVQRVRVIPGTGVSEVIVSGSGSSTIRAFLTELGTTPRIGEVLQVTNVEAVSSSSARRNAAIELARNYGSIGHRLQVTNPFGDEDVDVPAEVAAYQLAMWTLVDESGSDPPKATPRITTRAQALRRKAVSWDDRVPRPVPAPFRVVATSTPYLDGARVTVSALGDNPAGQLVELRSGPDLLAVGRVDETGKRHFDLPFEPRYEGTLTARWRGVLPAGTALRSPTGTTLLLAGSMPYALDSDAVEVVEPAAWGNMWGLARDRGMPVFLAGLVGFLAAMVVFVGASAIIDRVTTRRTLMAMVLSLGIAYATVYLTARYASRDFDASWTEAVPTQGPPVEIKDVSVQVPEATLELAKGKPSRGFSPSCLVDGSPWSSWRPRRHDGPLAVVRLSWPGNQAVTALSVLPGYFNGGSDAERLYLITGQPTLVQFFDVRGAAAERAVGRPAFVDIDSGDVPTAAHIDLPGAWSGPIYMRVIDIEQGKDSFALAELEPTGPQGDGRPTPQDPDPLLTQGPACSS